MHTHTHNTNTNTNAHARTHAQHKYKQTRTHAHTHTHIWTQSDMYTQVCLKRTRDQHTCTFRNNLNRSFFLLHSFNSFSALAWLEANTEHAWHSLSPAAPSNYEGTKGLAIKVVSYRDSIFHKHNTLAGPSKVILCLRNRCTCVYAHFYVVSTDYMTCSPLCRLCELSYN